ncbi:hypothetical protein DZC31_11880 [Stenotrophomonas rhizophila]|nr:hypothetical protein DZC31_11880 [Stenotrophomonas rhizophila]
MGPGWYCTAHWPVWPNKAGAALQPFRDTRPLLQEIVFPCRSGLVSRKGRKAAPVAPISQPGARWWHPCCLPAPHPWP